MYKNSPYRLMSSAPIQGEFKPFNVTGTLNRVEQVIGVVQSGVPLAVQYAPIVKNLPKLYRLMKAMNEVNKEDEKKSKVNRVHKQIAKSDHHDLPSSGTSIPKLYV